MVLKITEIIMIKGEMMELNCPTKMMKIENMAIKKAEDKNANSSACCSCPPANL